MKKNISNFKENDVTNFIKPLINVLNSLNTSYEKYYTDVENEIKNKILKLYNSIINEKFECYIINDKNSDIRIYIYDNGIVIRYSIDSESIDCTYNYLSKAVTNQIKKLISSNSVEFDKFSKETRSYIMSQIRGKDTKLEILVRSYLFSKGLRLRKNDRRYPGGSGAGCRKGPEGKVPGRR